MTREELREHMSSVHNLPADSTRSTEQLIADHNADHQSVISINRGFADHRHSEYLEVDGIPAER